ncbi:early endosome antigen 1 [Parasteatoda tepidariorum]|uniref:early endosome antigen 1 n=1 Tax=Parasteatoda tepidariorum TaxID=114398 RepID=UPI00077F8DCF|nr:centrosomal protein of 290 kDa [Parasteatoda tepidariorum]XP_042896672.1 centrosomal protein of 290 kDa [Parasteatoda tepidariorum]XP_042896673.1 centrosomal protein of 290 kDa [Parasteatoda tepidariorum]
MSLENDLPLDSLLVNIRSVVQSCKGGVLLSNLQDDYKKLIGTGIPFEKFGYNSLESLLQNASNFISIKKSHNGQLFAEAVTDSSTAHLANLISNQKSGKSKKGLKATTFKAKSCGSYGNRKYVYSSAANEKDIEIEELKNKWEKEKTMNEELSFEVNRLQTELKVANKALQFERNCNTQLKYQQEIEDLNLKLEREKKISRDFASQIIRLNSLVKINQATLSAEQDTIKKLKCQIGALQSSAVKEPIPVYEYLDSTQNSKIQDKCKSLQNLSSNVSWDGYLNFLETDAAKELNSCNNLTPDDDPNPMLAVLKSFKEQMDEQMQKFVNQIKKQNQKLMMLQQTQQRNYEELKGETKVLNESLIIENIVQKILEHPPFSKLESSHSFCASDNRCRSMQSITPMSSQSDNDSEQSFKGRPISRFEGSRYGPHQAGAYKVKKGYFEEVSYQRS